jgi:hypothetical protein
MPETAAKPMDVFIVVDSADDPVYRHPSRVARVLLSQFEVQSLTILERATGMTSTYRSNPEGATPIGRGSNA